LGVGRLIRCSSAANNSGIIRGLSADYQGLTGASVFPLLLRPGDDGPIVTIIARSQLPVLKIDDYHQVPEFAHFRSCCSNRRRSALFRTLPHFSE
jgi:hypothetical protein